MARLNKGTRLQVSDGGSPEAFATVPHIVDAPVLIGVTHDTEETTALEVPSKRKTFQPTLATEDAFTGTILWDENDTEHQRIKTLSESGETTNFRVLYPDGTDGMISFEGFVSAFAFVTPVGELKKATFTVMITGIVTDEPASISSVAVTDENAPAYVTNDVMVVTVTFDEEVVVDEGGGTPGITLDIDGDPQEAAYVSGSGSNVLNFEYTIGAGDVAELTEFAITSPIVLNSGTIKDRAGNNAVLTFTPPDTTGFTINPA